MEPNPVSLEISPDFPSHNALGIVDYSIAVSGDVFRWIIDFAPVTVLERVTLRL